MCAGILRLDPPWPRKVDTIARPNQAQGHICLSQESKAAAFLPPSSAPRKAIGKAKLPAGLSLLLLEEEIVITQNPR